ncbi:hypothetical protein AN960_20830 [Bacillus sp. FJAT-25509]|uniref:hypothetical protein n=1 Tax=Bacillus sp. FJAT-25509 TaxID=1712029 RepID=UPI0006F7C5CD|nr:hypothetical protein [Bacillus sp. FJAT-25509]KQL33523.1 hypothetical protein AN960_20830 [Bacillus sp. FJAT-25509]
MSNKKMQLSGSGKEILENIIGALEIDRPLGIKIALAKGIAISEGEITEEYKDSLKKWEIPDNIIKENEFTFFKHLIIEEVNKSLTNDELHKHMILYIECGLRYIDDQLKNLNSLEDARIKILN